MTLQAAVVRVINSIIIMLLIINEIVYKGDKQDEDAINELKTTRNHMHIALMLEMQYMQPYGSNMFAVNSEIITKYYYLLLKTRFWWKHYLWLFYTHCHLISTNMKEECFLMMYSPKNTNLTQKLYWYNFEFPAYKKRKTLRCNIWSNTPHFQGGCTCNDISKPQKCLNSIFTSDDVTLNITNYKGFIFNIQFFTNIEILRKVGVHKQQRALNLHQLPIFHLINRCQNPKRKKRKCICGLIKPELDRQPSACCSKAGILLKHIKTQNIQGKCNFLTQSFNAALFRDIPKDAYVHINFLQYTKKKIWYQATKNNQQKHISIEHPASGLLWKSSNYFLRPKHFVDSKSFQRRKLLSVTQSPQKILNAHPVFYLNNYMNNRQSDKHYDQNLFPERGYLSQEYTDKSRKHGKRRKKSNKEIDNTISSNSKDQHHIQVGKYTRLLQKKPKRSLENPSRYSKRQNRSHLRNSNKQRKAARHKRFSHYSHKTPFQNSPLPNINDNSLLLYPKQNNSCKENINSQLTNGTDTKYNLLAELWLMRKNRTTRMHSNRGTRLASVNLEHSVAIMDATLPKEFSTVPLPLVTEKQSLTQPSKMSISLSSEEQSSFQPSAVPTLLTTEEQISKQTSISVSTEEQSLMQLSTAPIASVSEKQSLAHFSTTSISLPSQDQSSVQLAMDHKPLVIGEQRLTITSTIYLPLKSEGQGSVQLSTVFIPLVTEEQSLTQPSTISLPLSSQQQSSVKLATVPVPLVAGSTTLSTISLPLSSQEQSSVQLSTVSAPLQTFMQRNNTKGHFGEDVKTIQPQNKELSQKTPVIITKTTNNSNKQCLQLFQKLLDEEKEQLNSEAKELEEHIEKILMAKIKSVYDSSMLTSPEIETSTSLMSQSMSTKSHSNGEEKAPNISIIEHKEIAFQEPAYDQEIIRDYGMDTTEFLLPNETDYEKHYEDIKDNAYLITESLEMPLVNTDTKMSTVNYPMVPTAMITPTSKICSQNDTNCICSVNNVFNDFLKFLLNPSFFLKNVEDYNCSTWIQPPSEILLSDNEQPIVKKKDKREAVMLMHSTEFLNLAKLEDMMHSADKLTITDKHVYAVPGSTVQMSCINIEEQIDLPSEYNFKWARSDGASLSEKNNQNVEDGIMTIRNVSIKDAGNYSCTVNFSNPVSGEANEHVFMHQLSLVLVPKFFFKGYAHYYAPSGCTKNDKQAFKLLFPNKIKQQLCGLSELCDVNIMHPKCHVPKKGKGTAEIIVIFLVHVNSITALIAGMDDDICDIMCRRKVELKFTMLLSSNAHTVFHIPVSYRSADQIVRYTPVPNSITYGILVGCSAGYFIQNDVCFPCPAGHYSIEDSASCMKCAKGTYQPEPGSSLCLRCPNPFAAATCAVDIETWHNRTGVYIGCIIATVIILICFCCCFCCWLYYRNKRKKYASRINEKLEDQTSTEVSDSESLSPLSRDGLTHRVSRKQVSIANEYEIANEAKSSNTELSNQKNKRSTVKKWGMVKNRSRKSSHSSGETEPLIATHAPDSFSKEQQPTNVTPTNVVADLFYSELKHSLNNLKKSSVFGSLRGLQSNGAKTIKNIVGVPVEDPVALLHLNSSLVDKSVHEDTLNKHGVGYTKIDHRSLNSKYDENNRKMKYNNVNQSTVRFNTVNLNHSNDSSNQPYQREYVPELPPTDF